MPIWKDQSSLLSYLICLTSFLVGVESHGSHQHQHHENHHNHSHPEMNPMTGKYDQGLHISAIFIVVGVSLLGSLGPVLLSLAKLRVNGFLLSLGLSIGAGTILCE